MTYQQYSFLIVLADSCAMKVELALLLSCAITVHPDTVNDIAWVESRMNPYAIGVVKGSGLIPRTRAQALSYIKQLEADNKNYSVGLMQINKANFKRYGVTAEALLDPCTNLSVFEKVITDCYTRGKTMPRALSCYYSGRFERGQKKESLYAGTSYTERVSMAPRRHYAVPSSRTLEHPQVSTGSQSDRLVRTRYMRIIYPQHPLKNTPYLPVYRPNKILRGRK